jgi:hypothetical protein
MPFAEWCNCAARGVGAASFIDNWSMTQSDREQAQVERAERTHKAVMETMAKEKPGTTTYTWRDRYLALFHMLWDKQEERRPQ